MTPVWLFQIHSFWIVCNTERYRPAFLGKETVGIGSGLVKSLCGCVDVCEGQDAMVLL